MLCFIFCLVFSVRIKSIPKFCSQMEKALCYIFKYIRYSFSVIFFSEASWFQSELGTLLVPSAAVILNPPLAIVLASLPLHSCYLDPLLLGSYVLSWFTPWIWWSIHSRDFLTTGTWHLNNFLTTCISKFFILPSQTIANWIGIEF